MKIDVVNIGDKYAVRCKSFLRSPEFYSKSDACTWETPVYVLRYCLFDTKEEAEKLRDMLRSVK